MNYHRFKKKVLAPLVVLPAILGMGMVQAQDTVVDTSGINDVIAVASETFSVGAETQVSINRLSDQADELMSDYRDAAKRVDALKVYNAKFRNTISNQEKTIAQYDRSIAEVAELQRQIPPLMETMLDGLDQFINLDIPFQLDVRRQRIDTIRALFTQPDVNIAEQFRQVLTAYTAELGYGRGLLHYTGTLDLNGVERDVDFFRVGRIALLYQTSDQTSTGAWDKDAKKFVELGNEYRRPVANGIRIAQKIATQEILELPIHAPE